MGGGRQALRPRLLVVVGLAAAVHACDVYLDAPLSSGIELALFAGFLSYKARRAPASGTLHNPAGGNKLAQICQDTACQGLAQMTSHVRVRLHDLACLSWSNSHAWILSLVPKSASVLAAAVTACGWPLQAALLLTLWDDLKPRSSKDGGLRPAPPQLATLPDPAAALAAEAGEPPAAEDPDDDGVVLTEDAQRAVDSILRREPRSVLKRLPRS